MDDLFVESLKLAMKANPSTDAAPIVGLVVLDESKSTSTATVYNDRASNSYYKLLIDETFDESKKETYQYETLGGNNSRVALQALINEDQSHPTFRTRLVSVYSGLSDDEAIRLATKHKISSTMR